MKESPCRLWPQLVNNISTTAAIMLVKRNLGLKCFQKKVGSGNELCLEDQREMEGETGRVCIGYLH